MFLSCFKGLETTRGRVVSTAPCLNKKDRGVGCPRSLNCLPMSWIRLKRFRRQTPPYGSTTTSP